MLEMARKDILPAAIAYTKELSETLVSKKAAVPSAMTTAEESLITKLSSLTAALYGAIETLTASVNGVSTVKGTEEIANYYRDHIVSAMQAMRNIADEMEICTAKNYWPFPTYDDLLHSVQ